MATIDGRNARFAHSTFLFVLVQGLDNLSLMPHLPDFATFSKLAATADYVPVYRRLLSDVLTPVSAFHKIDDGGCACLFESVIGGEKVGRYSFLAAEPFLEIEARGSRVTITRGRDYGNTRYQESARSIARPSSFDSRRRIAGVAAVRRRRGRIRWLRHGAIRRESAKRTARRPRAARSVVRVLRSHDRVR